MQEHAAANNIEDIRTDPFAYLYLYGLMVHKLGHFHDIVHGTRHDFFVSSRPGTPHCRCTRDLARSYNSDCAHTYAQRLALGDLQHTTTCR
jgi:hypothetical protein